MKFSARRDGLTSNPFSSFFLNLSAIVNAVPIEGKHLHSRGSTGCGKPHNTGYNNNDGGGFSITSSGHTRTYTINVPSNYNPNKATGLTISYHGRSGSSDVQHTLTQFGNEDWNPDLISVYPQGLQGDEGKTAWQGAPYARDGIDDLKFTLDLLDHLRSECCIDDARIYASGKSNGGGFVDALACSDVGRQFAAFSACSGAFYTDNALGDCQALSSKKLKIPFLETHGGKDGTVPYAVENESHGGTTPAIPNLLSWWAQRNGCAVDDKGTSVFPSQYGGQLNHTTWSCDGNDEIVQGYWIKDMDHDWPSTTSNPDNKEHGDGPTLIDAAPKIIDFYNRYTKV